MLHSLFISGNCSTCFGWYFHPSLGAHATVSTASVICQTFTTICRYRGRVGTGLSVLCLAYATVPDNVHQLHVQTTFHLWNPRSCQCSLRLLMIGGVSPETCWASYKYGIIKFETFLHLVRCFFMNPLVKAIKINVYRNLETLPQKTKIPYYLNQIPFILSLTLMSKLRK
jgi:hypothetical protein